MHWKKKRSSKASINSDQEEKKWHSLFIMVGPSDEAENLTQREKERAARKQSLHLLFSLLLRTNLAVSLLLFPASKILSLSCMKKEIKMMWTESWRKKKTKGHAYILQPFPFVFSDWGNKRYPKI